MCSELRMEEIPDVKKEKVSSTNRRTNKPLMEKRRRQRINECLNQLKSLVLQAMNKDTTQFSKLEKADILEMTVKHLKLVQRQHMTAAMTTDPNIISKYRAGFNECAAEISRYLDTVNGGCPELKNRVLNYLANSMMQFPVIPVYQGMVTPSAFPFQRTSLSQQRAYMAQYPTASINVLSPNTYPTSQSTHDFATHAQQSRSSPEVAQKFHVRSGMDASPPTTSPSHRIPSPCDSDSGLSDSSTSFSHDENGNYAQFSVNQVRASPTLVKSEINTNYKETSVHSERLPEVKRIRLSPKRCATDVVDRISPNKRIKTEPAVASPLPLNLAANNLQESDSMWRPW